MRDEAEKRRLDRQTPYLSLLPEMDEGMHIGYQEKAGIDKDITVAVMGCVVNGPGEAREADIGVAGGDGCGVIFLKGERKETLPYDELLPALLRYIEQL